MTTLLDGLFEWPERVSRKLAPSIHALVNNDHKRALGRAIGGQCALQRALLR